MVEEVKVVYLEKRREGEIERVIRGRIVEETNDSITIKRNDGVYTIFKRVITHIEKPTPVCDESDCEASFDGEAYR